MEYAGSEVRAPAGGERTIFAAHVEPALPGQEEHHLVVGVAVEGRPASGPWYAPMSPASSRRAAGSRHRSLLADELMRLLLLRSSGPESIRQRTVVHRNKCRHSSPRAKSMVIIMMGF